jgi:hypothetical protein
MRSMHAENDLFRGEEENFGPPGDEARIFRSSSRYQAPPHLQIEFAIILFILCNMAEASHGTIFLNFVISRHRIFIWCGHIAANFHELIFMSRRWSGAVFEKAMKVGMSS